MRALDQLPRINAIMLGFPPYIRPTQTEAVRYVEAVLECTTKDVILYNNPGRNGFDLSADSQATLIQHEQIIGVKGPGDAERVAALKQAAGRPLLIIAGGEHDMPAKIAWGYNMISSIAGNLNVDLVQSWFTTLAAGQTPPTDQLAEMDALIHAVYDNSPIPYLKKQITATTAIAMGKCRAPLGN